MKHFFDIGANIGQTFDDHLLKGRGCDGWTIWCFEPSPRHLSELRIKCDQMAETDHDWKINLCPFAIGGVFIWRRLFEKNDPKGDSFHSELFLQGNHVPNRETSVSVICTVMDIGYFVEFNIMGEDTVVIKIDAEGSEFEILERILEYPTIHPKIEKVMVEWHGIGTKEGKDEHHRSIQERLKAAGILEEGWPW